MDIFTSQYKKVNNLHTRKFWKIFVSLTENKLIFQGPESWNKKRTYF